MAKKAVCNKYGFPYDHTIIALRKAIPLGSLYIADYINPFGFDPREVCNFFDSYISFLNELISENGDEREDETEAEEVFSRYDNDENLVNWLGCYEESPFTIRLPQQTPYYQYGFGEWLEQFDRAKERKEERARDKQRTRGLKVA